MNNLTPHVIQVVDRYSDGEDAAHFTFLLPNQLQDTPVEPGQFFMLSVPGEGEAPFTYVVPPDNVGRFDVLVRKMGRLTSALIDGDFKQLGYRGPFGNGWPMNQLREMTVLAIAGGCGMAPVASFINHRILHKQEDNTVVIYGALNSYVQVLERERQYWNSQIDFIETLEQGTSLTSSSTPLDKIDTAVESFGGLPEAVVTCGPQAMMIAVAKRLLRMGVAPDNIFLSMERRMRCGVGSCGHCFIGSSYCCTDGPTYHWQQLLDLGLVST